MAIVIAISFDTVEIDLSIRQNIVGESKRSFHDRCRSFVADLFIDKLKQVFLITSDRAVDAFVEVIATACPSSCARGQVFPSISKIVVPV